MISRDELATRVGFVNKLAGNVDVPVYFSLVPDKSWVLSRLLPANAPNVDDNSTILQVRELCGDLAPDKSREWSELPPDGATYNVKFIDLTHALAGNDSFYRTDHHWTTMGAQRAYQALMEGMGLTHQAENMDELSYQVLSYTEVSDSF